MVESLETKVAILETKQTNIMDKLEEFQLENKEQHQELKIMIEKALESKAGKWVEGVIKWVGICIGAGILGYLGTLIVKVIEL